MQSRYRFNCAWLPGGWHRNVVISVDPDGDIVDVSADDTVTTARLINGAAIAGMPNIHSHAFQRAMAGLAEQRAGNDDSFWTWRETMYELASRMTPECLNAIAAQLYADMLKAGYTSVCEFHYLHSHGARRSHEDRLAMSQALIDAAGTAGIGLTLLPTLYQTSDFGAAPPMTRQQQFTMATKEYLDLLAALRQSSQRSPQLEVGIALHSLRAVPPDALKMVLDARRDDEVVHIHIAEQEREVIACQQHFGQRPVEWLLEHARLDKRWCLVHATHVTARGDARYRCDRRGDRPVSDHRSQSRRRYFPDGSIPGDRRRVRDRFGQSHLGCRPSKNCVGWNIRRDCHVASVMC